MKNDVLADFAVNGEGGQPCPPEPNDSLVDSPNQYCAFKRLQFLTVLACFAESLQAQEKAGEEITLCLLLMIVA